MDTKKILGEIAAEEKKFDAMYRKLAVRFGISDCVMWVMYFLSIADEPLSQQELAELMMFPKQTINSAVMNIAAKGWVTLEMIPGTRNKKHILLTDEGQQVISETIRVMRYVEEKAVENMGEKRVKLFIELYREYHENIESELEKAGLSDG